MVTELGGKLMYMSRICLLSSISTSSQLGLLLKDRNYGMHRLISDLFTNDERYLFREENSREQLRSTKKAPIFYVVSHSKPAIDSPIFAVESKRYDPSLKEGDILSFKLRANPTVARKTVGGEKSKRHDVVMNAQKQWLSEECQARGLSIEGPKRSLRGSLLAHADYKGLEGRRLLDEHVSDAIEKATVNWLEKRGASHGFELNSVQATGYQWNALPEKNRNAGFSSMDYEGVITVRDPIKILAMLSKGLGPSKAFGCGLMLVRRIE